MTYVLVKDLLIPAQINGHMKDPLWDERASKEITMQIDYTQVLELFTDDVDWSIVETYTYQEEVEGELINREERNIYDNSEYCVAGDVTIHKDGYVSVKMGKPTAEEILTLIEEAL